jgi:hypothetical protein
VACAAIKVLKVPTLLAIKVLKHGAQQRPRLEGANQMAPGAISPPPRTAARETTLNKASTHFPAGWTSVGTTLLGTTMDGHSRSTPADPRFSVLCLAHVNLLFSSPDPSILFHSPTSSSLGQPLPAEPLFSWPETAAWIRRETVTGRLVNLSVHAEHIFH